MAKKVENLPELVRKRKGAAVFWCIQGTDDGGGGAPEAERRKEDDAKRHEGENGKTPWPYL